MRCKKRSAVFIFAAVALIALTLAACELQITYSADLKEISLSAKDGYFDVKRSGKLTQSYDGYTEESAYEKVEQSYAPFSFIPE